ncbi:hypothetical protein HPB48_013966 [Haemaphysalis longicornis]|uniref:Endonuclease/exonuclease/phosphatase domain-containing protein n=1 Tax=Haemaphysalis longicornis TaxID=44386 RepID=A0A9J6G743_HAELO|nr:hypothetical protein HPB48_013966 [Haemaphysalis longicornis]
MLTHKRRVISVIGAYIPPRADVDFTYLSSVVHTCSGPHIAGDFKAHHPVWGSAATNKKGNDLADLFTTKASWLLTTVPLPFFVGSRTLVA